MARPRFRIQHMLALTTVVAIAIAGWLALQHVTSTRTIVAVDLPGNKRVRLIQKLDGEPFNTSIYFDAGDGRWGSYYYDHEDGYWNDADFDLDGVTLSIKRRGRTTIQLNTRTGFCIVERVDGRRHESDKPHYDTNPLTAETIKILCDSSEERRAKEFTAKL